MTWDEELVMKTVTENEQNFLIKWLRSYHDFLKERRSSSLLPRFYGLYNVKLPNKPVSRVVVMKNVFKVPAFLDARLVEKYDLKGSCLKRFVTKEALPIYKQSVLKDLNFCSRHAGTDDDGHEFKPTCGTYI